MRARRATALALTVIVFGMAWGPRAAEQEYSTEPLTQPAIMSTAEVAVDLARFNNWVVDHDDFGPDAVPPVREHAYLLIDSILKNRQHEGRTAFNGFESMALQQLFNLSTRLGVYGGGLVAKEIDRGTKTKIAAPLLPPDPAMLQLRFPYLVLSSKAAPWRFRFPYYFMLWRSQRYTAKNGFVTDLAILSTSFAKHDKGSGQSQATIMFIYSPKADCAQFNTSWLDLIGIAPANKTNVELLPNSQNFYSYDSAANMHQEVTMFGDSSGCYALGYSGIGGTYQANRVSYLDFMRSLERGTGTAVSTMPPTESGAAPAATQASRKPASD